MHPKSFRKINTGTLTGKMYVTLKTDEIFSLKTIHRFVKEVPKTFPETVSCNLRQLFQKLQDVVEAPSVSSLNLDF